MHAVDGHRCGCPMINTPSVRLLRRSIRRRATAAWCSRPSSRCRTRGIPADVSDRRLGGRRTGQVVAALSLAVLATLATRRQTPCGGGAGGIAMAPRPGEAILGAAAGQPDPHAAPTRNASTWPVKPSACSPTARACTCCGYWPRGGFACHGARRGHRRVTHIDQSAPAKLRFARMVETRKDGRRSLPAARRPPQPRRAGGSQPLPIIR